MTTNPEDYEKIKTISALGKELRNRNLCLFVGSGLSISSGLYNWKELLKPAAQALGLDIEKESSDLVSLAQYYFDKHDTNRLSIRAELEDMLRDAQPSKLHEIICSFPVENIWTTNYDTLIEDSYKKFSIHKEINIVSTESEISAPTRKWNTNIYKMHGCIQNKNSNIVLSTEDYESYPITNKGFLHELRSQLMSKTFLFIGFGFNDPNVSYAIRSLKNILQKNTGPHHLFILNIQQDKSESDNDFEYRTIKEQYRIKNLEKYGIKPTILKDENELYKALAECSLRAVKNRTVLCGSDESGSAADLCEKLGYEIAKNNYQLYTCFADGVGKQAVMGALRFFGENDEQYPYRKLRIWPTNSINKSSASEKEMYRRVMVKEAGSCIIINGKNGTLDEFSSAASEGRLCIPIGHTGGTANKVIDQTIKNIEILKRSYNFSDDDIKTIKDILNQMKHPLETDKTIDLVMRILRLVENME
jgi:predicted Rossmann-fold nucleotide-binding protein/NAD-dependent SIR2 family protein deacetylase